MGSWFHPSPFLEERTPFHNSVINRLLKSAGLLKRSFSNINKHLWHICCGRANNIQIPASHLIGPRLEITQSHSMKWQREINKPILLTSCMYWNSLKKKSATSQRQRKQGNRYSVFQTIPPTNRIVECVLPKCGGNVETSLLWLWRWLSVTMWTEAVSWLQNIQWINTSDHAAAVTPCLAQQQQLVAMQQQ